MFGARPTAKFPNTRANNRSTLGRAIGMPGLTGARGRGKTPVRTRRSLPMKLQLSLAVCDYDRTRAIFDGRAEIEGCDITAVALEPEESFHRAFKFNEFDISEISMSSYLATTSRGEAHYFAIPAFVSRLF